jgi:CheY-like chemotaxis protein
MEILLADSSPVDRDYERNVINSYLLNAVRVVGDGAEALAAVFGADGRRVRVPQVVFADMRMGRVPTLDFVRALRGDARTSHVPIVILTSSDDDDAARAALRREQCAFVTKPIDLNRMAEALRQIGVRWVLVDGPLPSKQCEGVLRCSPPHGARAL